MVIHLNRIDHFLVAAIMEKMTPDCFRNACLSSKHLNQVATNYRRSIRIRLPDHEIIFDSNDTVDRGEGNELLIVQIKKHSKGDIYSFECRPDELFLTRPELVSFQFERLHLYHPSKSVILEAFRKERITCNRFYIEADENVNQAVLFLQPCELILPDIFGALPNKIVDHRILEALNHVEIYVDKEQQMANCLENMLYRVPSLKISAGAETLRKVEPTLKLVKNVIEKIRYSPSSTVNESFFLYTNIPSSVNLKDLIRPFREIPHSSWKTYAKFGESLDSFAFLFMSTAHQTTLVLFLEEELLSARGKGLTISYIVARSMEQFLMFYAKCRHLRAPVDVEKVFGSRKKRLQFNFVKKEYFSVN